MGNTFPVKVLQISPKKTKRLFALATSLLAFFSLFLKTHLHGRTLQSLKSVRSTTSQVFCCSSAEISFSVDFRPCLVPWQRKAPVTMMEPDSGKCILVNAPDN